MRSSRSSRRPPRADTGGAHMERNKVAWTMLHQLGLTPADPAWKATHVLNGRRRRARPDR